jgi:hypothetical protein
MANSSEWNKLRSLHEVLPGGSPGEKAWTREDGGRTLTCPSCSNIRLVIRQESMARQDRRKRASRRRLVAYCPKCRDAWRLRVGGPR